MKSLTYISVLFLAIIICFIASFDKRIQFNHQFKAFIKAAILVAIPFIAWDVWFTSRGVWWFDTNYTLGLVIAGLPLEEWLFFICIPFSCVFTFYSVEKFFNLDWADAFSNIIVFASVIIIAVVGLYYIDRIYTFVTALITLITLIYLHFIARAQWIGRASFLFAILMLGFFLVNGVLTGTGLESPIVNYNPKDFIGFRMLTIPVEDAVYGYSQFLWVLFFFKKFQKKQLT